MFEFLATFFKFCCLRYQYLTETAKILKPFFSFQHYRYLKPSNDFKGGLVPSEAPVQVSEVSLLDPSDGWVLVKCLGLLASGDLVRECAMQHQNKQNGYLIITIIGSWFGGILWVVDVRIRVALGERHVQLLHFFCSLQPPRCVYQTWQTHHEPIIVS